MKRPLQCVLISTAAVLLLTACKFNDRPAFIQGPVTKVVYDGVSNDLLTAGLGADGLAGAAPVFADALNPTPDELRKLAIYNNYRALVNTAPGGGYGEFFGPQVGTAGDGMVAGTEYLAFMGVAGSDQPVTVMVQVPDQFDPAAPCMVTAPSSGSRGIYGAIGTAGEWGLKKGCAVVYTDKGTGTGAHNLMTNGAQTLDGTLTTDPAAPVQFRAGLSDTERQAFNAAHPDRFAFKHAHSAVNPEADWGQHVLQSIEFGFYILNEQFGISVKQDRVISTITPENTLVIASSVSNGGGASVRAAEQDRKGRKSLIDGIAVSEPNVNPQYDRAIRIVQGAGPAISGHSRSLLDYTTALAVYQGCANLAPGIRDEAPFNGVLNNFAVAENICTSLFNKGLLTGTTVDARATEAQQILQQEFAIQPEQNLVAPSHFGANVAQSIAMTYANAYGRFGVEDRLCGLSLAASSGITGEVTPLGDAQEAALFAVSNGIPPTGGVNVIYDQAVGVPTLLPISQSPSTSQMDFGLDALLCLRGLATGVDPLTGDKLTGHARAQARAIAKGIKAIRASGDLQGKPAVFVTGRADAVLPINHTSRPYYGLNQKVEGAASGLRYYEVLNAHHLDAFNAFPGFDSRYVPLHHYYGQAMDLMYDHLRTGAGLPPSQVVRAIPRGSAPALTPANLPAIAAQPAAGDLIHYRNGVVQIPD
ncbi:3-hydroxybutyrate oligomer hydrolase family protein [Marinobacter sp. X15-166B]|uniref:3-hydroxybutyrate oligomer hydrolase family protein n=1 Tax=Marinobacter sp. X15-166B TaxID=1897620 RepID=UPI00085BC7B0|nr:3-hydroxybutyrate oligomer hydrolase family protein [Marinobacter sp. X15-166B]OEY66178.1 D-(-)-3-hydroxybutyrate oligomer hydrolase [Marinobacter sp. X15-166B]